MNTETLHPIRVVAMRTGVSTHVIRAWEKRHSAVRPKRTGTNRRMYSDADIERLQLLKTVTDAGRGISQVADLANDELRQLATEDGESRLRVDRKRAGESDAPSEYHLDKCLSAVKSLDAHALETSLLQASVTLPSQTLVEEVVLPLMMRLGEMWQHGNIRPVHEHLASSVVRTLLGNIAGANAIPSGAPDLLVATPAGQVHEFGALAVAATAASEGWRVSYLGANLPAEDIAAAAVSREARAVAISLVYPTDDVQLHGELNRLRKLLPAETTILAGGRAAPAYEATLSGIGAQRVSNLSELREALRSCRLDGHSKQAQA